MNPENNDLPATDDKNNTAAEGLDSTEETPTEAEATAEPLTVNNPNETGAEQDATSSNTEQPGENNAGETAASADDAAEPAEDTAAPDDETDEADVIFDGERPIVQELQYKAPRAKTAPEEGEGESENRFSSVAEARAVIEGFLFSSNEPLSVARLSKLMGNLHPKTVRGLLLELQWEYENRSSSALQIVEIAGGYQMATRPYVAPWMFRLHKLKRRSPLSPATLETLAIIAYRQPITKGEMETIRGVETGAPLRTLQELGLVEARGRREVIGRPQLYVTTEQFLKVFGLKSIADLPSISELKSKFSEEQKLKPKTATPATETQDEPAEDAAAPEPADETPPSAEENAPEQSLDEPLDAEGAADAEPTAPSDQSEETAPAPESAASDGDATSESSMDDEQTVP